MLQTKWFRVGLPLAVLALIGTAIGVQRHELTELERGNEALRERIARVTERANAPAEAAEAARANGASAAAAGKRIDWKKIAELKARSERGGVTEMRAMVALQQALLEMSTKELLEQLDEIAALDAPAEVKRQLEGAILGVLGQKDPERALDRFAGRLGDPRAIESWQLAFVFQQWVTKDVAAASVWMDRQVAAGAFVCKSLEDKNEIQRHFETLLLCDWISRDPAAAGERVAAMPEALRSDVLKQDLFSKLKPGDEKAMADLIRRGVAGDQSPAVLAQSSAHLALDGGYERVGRFLGSIEAGTEERNAIAAMAVKTLQLNQDHVLKNDPAATIDAAREWVGKEAPAVVGKVTGEALTRVADDNFDQVTKLAVQYHESSADDSVLVAFLKSENARNHREAALPLVDRIADPAQREEVRKSFTSQKR